MEKNKVVDLIPPYDHWSGATILDHSTEEDQVLLLHPNGIAKGWFQASYLKKELPRPPEQPGGDKEGGGVSESDISDALFKGNCPPGTKADQGKPRWDLMPWDSLREVTKVITYGANKYADDNWKAVSPSRIRYTRAAIGHIVDWFTGEENDTESGLHHLAHATCCLLFLLWFDLNGHNEKEPSSDG